MNEMEFIPKKTCLYPFLRRIQTKKLRRKKTYISIKSDSKRTMDLMQIRTDDYAKAVSSFLRDVDNLTWEQCRPVITIVEALYTQLKIKIVEETERKANEKVERAESSSPTGTIDSESSSKSSDSGRTDTSENDNVGALLDSFATYVNLIEHLTLEDLKNLGEVIICFVRSEYFSFAEKTPLFSILASMDPSLDVLKYIDYYVRKH